MDYEKLYKEALSRARKLHDKHPYGEPPIWKTCEEIFPELKESDDERIRKSLINMLSQDYELHKREIAWLEKQCENSVCKIKIGETYKCIASPRYTCFRIGDIYHVTDNFVAELINICSDCFVLLEKQGEKPAEKTKHINRSYTTSNQEFFQWIYDRLVYVYNENPNVDYMVSLKERIDDMQNPFWSEEDEEMKRAIVSNLFILKGMYTHPDKQTDYNNMIEWLKSLKPQHRWKPSKEQMYLLNWLANTLLSNDGIVEREAAKILNELYNGLKSL